MNFRDWLITIGLIVIAGLIVDAARRLWTQRRIRNEITFGLQSVKGGDDVEEYTSELPNGGARVKDAGGTDTSSSASEPEKAVFTEMDFQRQYDEGRDEPPLDEFGYEYDNAHGDCHDVAENEMTDNKDENGYEKPAPQKNNGHEEDFSLHLMPVSESIIPEGNEFPEHTEAMDTSPASSGVSAPVIAMNAEAGKVKYSEKTVANNHFDREASMHLSDVEKKEVLVVHVEAKENQPFSGDRLLQVLLDNGLRHGDMNIFHYTRKERHKPAEVLFSVANGMEPGSFDMKNMRHEDFRILTFMMFLPGPETPVEAFKVMIDTVDAVSRYLFADVKDENRCIMTLQMLEYYRERVLEYQRIQMLEQHIG